MFTEVRRLSKIISCNKIKVDSYQVCYKSECFQCKRSKIRNSVTLLKVSNARKIIFRTFFMNSRTRFSSTQKFKLYMSRNMSVYLRKYPSVTEIKQLNNTVSMNNKLDVVKINIQRLKTQPNKTEDNNNEKSTHTKSKYLPFVRSDYFPKEIIAIRNIKNKNTLSFQQFMLPVRQKYPNEKWETILMTTTNNSENQKNNAKQIQKNVDKLKIYINSPRYVSNALEENKILISNMISNNNLKCTRKPRDVDKKLLKNNSSTYSFFDSNHFFHNSQIELLKNNYLDTFVNLRNGYSKNLLFHFTKSSFFENYLQNDEPNFLNYKNGYFTQDFKTNNNLTITKKKEPTHQVLKFSPLHPSQSHYSISSFFPKAIHSPYTFSSTYNPPPTPNFVIFCPPSASLFKDPSSMKSCSTSEHSLKPPQTLRCPLASQLPEFPCKSLSSSQYSPPTFFSPASPYISSSSSKCSPLPCPPSVPPCKTLPTQKCPPLPCSPSEPPGISPSTPKCPPLPCPPPAPPCKPLPTQKCPPSPCPSSEPPCISPSTPKCPPPPCPPPAPPCKPLPTQKCPPSEPPCISPSTPKCPPPPCPPPAPPCKPPPTQKCPTPRTPPCKPPLSKKCPPPLCSAPLSRLSSTLKNPTPIYPSASCPSTLQYPLPSCPRSFVDSPTSKSLSAQFSFSSKLPIQQYPQSPFPLSKNHPLSNNKSPSPNLKIPPSHKYPYKLSTSLKFPPPSYPSCVQPCKPPFIPKCPSTPKCPSKPTFPPPSPKSKFPTPSCPSTQQNPISPLKPPPPFTINPKHCSKIPSEKTEQILASELKEKLDPENFHFQNLNIKKEPSDVINISKNILKRYKDKEFIKNVPKHNSEIVKTERNKVYSYLMNSNNPLSTQKVANLFLKDTEKSIRRLSGGKKNKESIHQFKRKPVTYNKKLPFRQKNQKVKVSNVEYDYVRKRNVLPSTPHYISISKNSKKYGKFLPTENENILTKIKTFVSNNLRIPSQLNNLKLKLEGKYLQQLDSSRLNELSSMNFDSNGIFSSDIVDKKFRYKSLNMKNDYNSKFQERSYSYKPNLGKDGKTKLQQFSIETHNMQRMLKESAQLTDFKTRRNNDDELNNCQSSYSDILSTIITRELNQAKQL